MNDYPEHVAEIKQSMGALGREIPDTMQAFMGCTRQRHRMGS